MIDSKLCVILNPYLNSDTKKVDKENTNPIIEITQLFKEIAKKMLAKSEDCNSFDEPNIC